MSRTKADVTRLARIGVRYAGRKSYRQVEGIKATITPLKQGRKMVWDIVFTAGGIGEVGHIWAPEEPDYGFLCLAIHTEPAKLYRRLRARPAPIGFYA